MLACLLGACAPKNSSDAADEPAHVNAATEPPAIEATRLDAAGCELAALVCGDVAAPLVLLLHGGRFRANTWRDLGTLEDLALHGYRGVAVDLPGFGDSARCDAAPAALLEGLLDRLGAKRTLLVSPSMSGRFALPFVRRHGERLAGWVALAPVGELSADERLAPPILALWGQDDRTVPAAFGQALVAASDDARSRFEEVPLPGHAWYPPRPEALHRRLRVFLDEVLPVP